MLTVMTDRHTTEAQKRAIEDLRGAATRYLLTGECQSEGGAIRELDRHGRCDACGSDQVTTVCFRWVR